jgi:hypothetical protein
MILVERGTIGIFRRGLRVPRPLLSGYCPVVEACYIGHMSIADLGSVLDHAVVPVLDRVEVLL